MTEDARKKAEDLRAAFEAVAGPSPAEWFGLEDDGEEDDTCESE